MNLLYGPILVVDDVKNVQELLEITLRFKGYPVITANNGQEALQQIEQHHPALIITDILMPKMDGYAMVQKLRKNPLTANIPVIFISATYITSEDKKFALSLGGVRFIEKPIDTEDFLITVAEILTQNTLMSSANVDDDEFYKGYNSRLETKLRHKNTQITRTERLLKTLPEDQRPAFESLLMQAIHDRDEIQAELDQVQKIIGELKMKPESIEKI
jgi:CheY-like chemotaxis protein